MGSSFQICPIFSNMFSDLPSRPRVQLLERGTSMPAAKSFENDLMKTKQKPIDVNGADRAHFFVTILNVTLNAPLKYAERPYSLRHPKCPSADVKLKSSVKTQTQYREEATQSDPWEPPYVVIGDGHPEILRLEFLKAGSSLPVGMHEVQLIERARMKRAWNQHMAKVVVDQNSLDKFRDYIEAIERDEWAFREKEIQDIQDMRIELLEQALNAIHSKANYRNKLKIKHLTEKKDREKHEMTLKLQKRTNRELRKLERAQKGIGTKYKEMDIIEEHIDPKSELFAPLMRNGEHPKRWHQVIDERMRTYKSQFIGVEDFSTLPTWLYQTDLKQFETARRSKERTSLCLRETKWTASVLKDLHGELKNMKKKGEKRPCTLRTKTEKIIEIEHIERVPDIPDEIEDLHQALICIQSIIKGRASQTIIFEGRDRCRELINELKCSQGLMKDQKRESQNKKWMIKALQRDENKKQTMVDCMQSALSKEEGSIIGPLLDFLNKELQRLIEERKADAACRLYERERTVREAEEAGRRQIEIQRRKEHDEIFKQTVKVTQDSVDLYLEGILTEGLDKAARKEALRKVEQWAEKIERKYEDDEIWAASDVIADLVHHFLLPEVDKVERRRMVAAQQKEKLRAIHDTIFEGDLKAQREISCESISPAFYVSDSPVNNGSEFDGLHKEEFVLKVVEEGQDGDDEVSVVDGVSVDSGLNVVIESDD